ncbi:hypothetical protein BD410DRAFT_449934 [Rickenella mellea]|uniref:Uncharacterized protein n=1 Tax=Rickenella mellea TaxID=50990 RepID=A0A4Y7PVJ4_9AGAM|nr:hypothetical protein BD410DRAFT_449934 [Rickenella mellea]
MPRFLMPVPLIFLRHPCSPLTLSTNPLRSDVIRSFNSTGSLGRDQLFALMDLTGVNVRHLHFKRPSLICSAECRLWTEIFASSAFLAFLRRREPATAPYSTCRSSQPLLERYALFAAPTVQTPSRLPTSTSSARERLSQASIHQPNTYRFSP